MRNLVYPLDWDEVFDYIGVPGVPQASQRRRVEARLQVHNPQEFFDAYDETGDLVMTLQQGIEFEDYVRCY